jgi:hypothetical protein
MKDLEVRTLEQIYHSLKGKLLFEPLTQARPPPSLNSQRKKQIGDHAVPQEGFGPDSFSS